MPCIAQIPGGIKIEMYPDDHHPPHFHAIHAEDEALFRIVDLVIFRGSLPAATERTVRAWARTRPSVQLGVMRGQTESEGYPMTVAPDDAAAPALRKIRSVRVRPRYRLEVQWDENGPPMIIDMEELITEGAAFAPLRDADLFATARIGERHRTIEWPDPIHPGQLITDCCADALYIRGERQRYGSFL